MNGKRQWKIRIVSFPGRHVNYTTLKENKEECLAPEEIKGPAFFKRKRHKSGPAMSRAVFAAPGPIFLCSWVAFPLRGSHSIPQGRCGAPSSHAGFLGRIWGGLSFCEKPQGALGRGSGWTARLRARSGQLRKPANSDALLGLLVFSLLCS